MASPAFSSDIQTRQTNWFKVPNEFAEHQSAFIPAERALALLIFRYAKNSKNLTDLNGTARISDSQWRDWTGLEPRMKENAIRGLRSKGLEVKGRGDKAEFYWDWTRWHTSLKNQPARTAYDPNRKERDQKNAATKIHPDCKMGCARLRECQPPASTTNNSTPFLVTNIAQPVAQTPKQATEQRWAKTLSAMRDISFDVGLGLLMKILAVIASFGAIADGVLAAAVRNAAKYQQRGLQKIGPILLVKIIPNILATWKAKGMRLDVDPDDGARAAHIGTDKELLKMARDIIRDVEAGDTKEPPWQERDIEWARETVFNADKGS